MSLGAISNSFQVSDSATPFMAALLKEGVNLRALKTAVGNSIAVGVRQHIINAASSRHRTARRLGAVPTGHLIDRANSVDSQANAEGIDVTIAGAPGIFARVKGEVVIVPLRGKYLAFPCHASSFGKRAREISGMVFAVVDGFGKCLCRVDAKAQKRKDWKLTPLFLLRKKVTLSQDAGLLPSPEQMGPMIERGAVDAFETLEAEYAANAAYLAPGNEKRRGIL